MGDPNLEAAINQAMEDTARAYMEAGLRYAAEQTEKEVD